MRELCGRFPDLVLEGRGHSPALVCGTVEIKTHCESTGVRFDAGAGSGRDAGQIALAAMKFSFKSMQNVVTGNVYRVTSVRRRHPSS